MPAGVVSITVTESAIAADVLARMVASPTAGAVATFAGVVRDHHAGRAVAFLEYEAYVPMAERELREIATAACGRFAIEAIAIHHRHGRLEIGDVAVAIAVSAAHRAAAFDALRFAIDTLKARVPIWKRETGPDGTYWIEGPDQVAAES